MKEKTTKKGQKKCLKERERQHLEEKDDQRV